MFKNFTVKNKIFLMPIMILLLAGCFAILPSQSETVLAQDAPAGAATAAPVTNNPATGGAVTNTPGGTDGGIPTVFGYSGLDFINFILAGFMNFLLGAAAFLLTMSASILDVSLIMTLHIKDFVEATPAIYTIWQVIRDITGLFFIFFLLYAAILMILNMGGSYGKLIKDIVVAGILINFSFFIVSVLIDASNIVSQAIYNSMNPSSQTVTFDKNTNLRDLTSNITGLNQTTSTAKGISNVFMNSLKIQSIYDTSGNKLTSVIGNPIRIILVGLTGVIIMITAAASFILAALAFIARLVILLFLLMFSSLWFAGMIIPQLNEHVGKFKKALSSQLLFMPVYFLLMYAALRILNDSNLMGAANASIQGLPTGTNWAFPFIVLAINFAMVIFMLNLPLVVGLGMGGQATDFLKKSISKWDAGNVWGYIGGKVRAGTVGVAGTGTLGRFGSWADKKLGATRIGNSYYGRDIRSGTTGALATGKYGGERSWEDKAKINKEIASKSKEILRRKEYKTAFDEAKAGIPFTGKTLKETLSQMSEKERLALGAKTLKDLNIVKHLKGDDFDAIKKSEEFTLEQKKEISDARKAALLDASNKNEEEVLKHMVQSFDGTGLLGLGKDESGRSIVEIPNIVEYMKISQLKKMGEEGLKPESKTTIKNIIEMRGEDNHSAYGWVKKNWARV